jgi:hypothetical protein
MKLTAGVSISWDCPFNSTTEHHVSQTNFLGTFRNKQLWTFFTEIDSQPEMNILKPPIFEWDLNIQYYSATDIKIDFLGSECKRKQWRARQSRDQCTANTNSLFIVQYFVKFYNKIVIARSVLWPIELFLNFCALPGQRLIRKFPAIQ